MKIKAYTILEALLTLIIASLIIVFMYTAYLYLDKQMINYQKDTKALISLMTLRDILKEDIYLSKTLIEKNNGLFLEFYDGSKVSYITKADSLYRQINEGNLQSMGLEVESFQSTKKKFKSEVGYYIKVPVKLNGDTTHLNFTKFKRIIVEESKL